MSFASDFFNLLFVRFQQAGIFVLKRLIQGCNCEALVGVELLTCDHDRRKNKAPNNYATQPNIMLN